MFESELEQVLKGIREVPGVTSIESQLESHAGAGYIPALQGVGPLKIQAVPGWIRWTPTTRVMAGAAGLALMVVASRRRMVRGMRPHE